MNFITLLLSVFVYFSTLCTTAERFHLFVHVVNSLPLLSCILLLKNVPAALTFAQPDSDPSVLFPFSVCLLSNKEITDDISFSLKTCM